MTATEYVVLVDEQDNEIGAAEKLSAHQQNLLHRAFSVFVFRFNKDSGQPEVLLQQRALHKYHSPGLWTNTCCSHPRPGESVLEGGKRRLFEEMGIEVELRDVGSFHYNAHFSNGLAENELDHVLVAWVDNIDINANPDEVNHWEWMSVFELKQRLEATPENYTAWIKQALEIAQHESKG